VENLRAASGLENMRNASQYSHNTSGVNGVYWEVARRKWCAQIQVRGKHINLGNFDTKQAAVCARQAADVLYGFSKTHGRRTRP
jgi:hypothetical protein